MHPALYQSLVTNVLAPRARVVRAGGVFSRGIRTYDDRQN